MFLRSIETVFIMIILIGVGWIMSYVGWVTNEVKKFLNNLIVKVCVPALTISNLFGSFSKEMLESSFKYVFISFISMFILLLISKVLSVILRIEPIKVGSFISMSSVSNSMFFGLPVTLGLFGDIGLPYILFYYIANTVMFWGIFTPMMYKDGGLTDMNSLSGRFRKIFNAPMVTIVIVGILLYFNFTPPNIVLDASKYFSNLVTPLACIVVGKIINDINFKKYKVDPSVLGIIMMRFLIAPISMFLICRFFKLPMLASQVLIIQSAMPVMMQTTMVSEISGTDSRYVATALSVTTILSLFFIPLYMIIIEAFA